MGQITIYLDEETERIVRQHAKRSGDSASKWIADAVRSRARREWPASVAVLFGSWQEDDFPDEANLRKYGRDVGREKL